MASSSDSTGAVPTLQQMQAPNLQNLLCMLGSTAGRACSLTFGTVACACIISLADLACGKRAGCAILVVQATRLWDL